MQLGRRNNSHSDETISRNARSQPETEARYPHHRSNNGGSIIEAAFWVQGVGVWTTFYAIDHWKRSVDSAHKVKAAMSGSKKPTFLQDWPTPRADQKLLKQTMRKKVLKRGLN
jgi:hypothetical protein